MIWLNAGKKKAGSCVRGNERREGQPYSVLVEKYYGKRPLINVGIDRRISVYMWAG